MADSSLTPSGFYQQRGKRILDVVAAAAILVVVSPLLLLVALAIRISMGAPVLYRQRRPGFRETPFELLKFRTMRPAREVAEEKVSDAGRLTPLGRWLRSTSLDELPELWNVLKGDMSLVGPRPLLMEYLPLYSPEQARRHEVRPGMTGLAQVSGRNALTWEEKFRLDIRYVEHYSLTLDVKLLIQTIRAVVTARGIAAEGSATMPAFTGAVSREQGPRGDA